MINWKENKTFCPYAFKGALIKHNNNVVPCCRWNSWALTEDGSKSHRHSESLDLTQKNLINYETYFDDVRKKMLKGEVVRECVKCYQQEQDGVNSMRLSAIRDFVKKPEKLKQLVDHRGPKGLHKNMYKPRLEYLEIESGRYCNLKCRSCGPGLSSSWDEDLKNNKKAVENFYGNDHHWYEQEKKGANTNESLAMLSYEDCKHLTEIKVTGGEPFLTDAFLKFVENLVNWDLSKNIILDVFTNASFYPKAKHTKLLTKFKFVDINMSIDGVGKHNEFLRKKSKWSVIEKVTKQWEKLALDNKNISIGISHTLTIFNCLHYIDFLKWCKNHFNKKMFVEENGKPAGGNFVDFAVAYGPDYLAIRNFSSSVKKELLRNIYDQWEELQQLPEYESKNHRLLAKGHLDGSFRKIIKTLQNTDGDNINLKFKEKTELFDKIRNENWKEVFPELVEVLNV